MNKYLKVLLAAVVVVGFTSCLKDKEFDDHIYGHTGLENNKIVELGFLNTEIHEKSVAVDFVDVDTSVAFLTVRLAANEVAAEDIVVTLDTTNSIPLIDEYNDANGTEVVKLSSSLFTYTNGLKVTIPKGSREGYLKISYNAFDLDPSTTYAIGFKIASVDKSGYTISQNFREFLTLFGAKNKYDGVYKVTGTLVDVANAAFGPWQPSWTAHLVTIGANTNDVYDMTYTGDVFHPFFNAGSPSYYGTFGMEVTFDPATNNVASVVSPYVPAANTRSAALDPSFVSTFDPATHNVRIKYFMYQPNTVAVGPRVIFDETWTYVGPR